MMSIKNIIFDFGGVLLNWDPKILYKNHFSKEEDMLHFLENVCTNEWNLKQDEGRTFNEAINELLSKYPQFKKEIELYHSNWIEMVAGKINENCYLIPFLKEKYRLFGLTNWSAETFPLVYEKYPFFKELEGIVVSGEEKTIKPNLEIYQILLNRFSINSSESLFIDDNQDNIIAAQKLGFKTIHFGAEVNLKDELIKLGLLF